MALERIYESRITGRNVVLYSSGEKDSPLVVLNAFSEENTGAEAELIGKGDKKLNLLIVSVNNWNHDMTPWYAEPFGKKEPCTGGADDYLKELTQIIIPKVTEKTGLRPEYCAIAGYSLAGLFAIYSLYKTDLFRMAASVSGSLWYPDFLDHAMKNELKATPLKVYLSLGDKEANSRNMLLKTVQGNTEKFCRHLESKGIPVKYELNPGGHFQEPEVRLTKGIAYMISKEKN